MTLIALPAGFCPNSFSLRQQTNQRMFESPFGGSEQVIDMLNDRWMVSMSLPNRLHADAARVEAFIASLRGMTNTVALYHWARKQPRGTMRGTPSCGAISAGAQTIFIGSAGAGATLLAGDMIGIAGLLLQVAADVTADGAGLMPFVPLVNSVRKDIPSNTPVIWDKPTAPFRLASPSSVQYIPGYAPEVALDFVESIV